MDEDIAIPFILEGANYRGKLIKLNSVLQKAFDYSPDLELPYKEVYAQLITIAVTIASDIKFSGNLKVQFIGSDTSIIKAILIDCNKNAYVRSLIQLNDNNIKNKPSFREMVEGGSILIHLDHGLKETYQSVLAIQDSDSSWEQLFQNWFITSDQVSTILKVIFNHEMQCSAALFLQKMPQNVISAMNGLPLEDIENTLSIITDTLQINEITLLPQEILYRLYHDFEVRVYDPVTITYKCNCSQEKMATMLKLLTPEEIEDIRRENQGYVIITCTFCNTVYKL